MSSSDQSQSTSVVHRGPRLSTTIDRRRVARPSNSRMIKKNGDTIIKRPQPKQPDITPVGVRTQQQKIVDISMKTTRPTAKQLKETAIEKALASAVKNSSKKQAKKSPRVQFGFKRVMLALACAAVAVFAIVYFVNLNAPDISLKVAAMQTGIEASYPSYVPRDFSLSDITSENGKITLNFKNPSTGDAFSLVEEKSSWDSNTLLNNFVRENFDKDFTTMREQGLTIYIDNINAAWVNGGVDYKLNVTSGSRTKKQIRSIAVSL